MRWQTSDLDDILLNGDLLFKSINKFQYLGIDDMPNILKIKNSFLTIEYLENKTAEFVVKEYLTTISEIISACQFRGNGAMLFVNGFTLGIIWNNNSFYLFDSHSRDSSGNPTIYGTSVLLKFNSISYIDEYIRKMYLEKQPISVYFQIQFIRVVCSMEDISNIQADL